MKSKIKFSLLPALLFACLLLFTAVSCKKSVTTVTSTQNTELWLTGNVVNAVTNQAIPNARVYITGSTVITTDANGVYRINTFSLVKGGVEVRAVYDGFGFGSAMAQIGANTATVNTIRLNPLGPPVSVGPSGSTIIVADPESITAGTGTSLTIPAGAFNQTISVRVTRFTGIGVPGYAPANSLNGCTVNLNPESTVTTIPMDLSFALPASGIGVDQLPLLLYSVETNAWTATGTFATVNHAANTALAHITSFGTYSLGLPGTYTEAEGSGGTVVKVPLDPSGSSIQFTYLAKNTYPNGTPSTISLVYLVNLVSQNSKVPGARISFADSTTLIMNYIGTKPDSVVAQSSATYKWKPQYGYNWVNTPTTTTLNGTPVSGIIEIEHFGDCGFWQYVHDQGGGGK